MQSHHESSMRSSAVTLMGGPQQSNSIISASTRYPTLAGGGGGSHDLMSKLKELEAENAQLKAQHEKQNVLVTRYKERWELLKENAKKRRASTISSPITEENESWDQQFATYHHTEIKLNFVFYNSHCILLIVIQSV